jgi:hypothetical protein
MQTLNDGAAIKYSFHFIDFFREIRKCSIALSYMDVTIPHFTQISAEILNVCLFVFLALQPILVVFSQPSSGL